MKLCRIVPWQNRCMSMMWTVSNQWPAIYVLEKIYDQSIRISHMWNIFPISTHVTHLSALATERQETTSLSTKHITAAISSNNKLWCKIKEDEQCVSKPHKAKAWLPHALFFVQSFYINRTSQKHCNNMHLQHVPVPSTPMGIRVKSIWAGASELWPVTSCISM